MGPSWERGTTYIVGTKVMADPENVSRIDFRNFIAFIARDRPLSGISNCFQ